MRRQKMTRHYPNLCKDTCFVTGIDKKRREIPLAPIYNALGATKAASLPGFHPLSRGDVTDWFAGKGKLTFLKVLEEPDPDDDKIQALLQLHVVEQSSEVIIVAIEPFLSVIFASHWIDESSRCKVVAFQEETCVIRRSPPQKKKKAGLLPAIMRAHYQALIQYNIGIYKAPFSKDACKAQNTIQKANNMKMNTRKCKQKNAKLEKTWYMDIKYDFNWVLKVSKLETSVMVFWKLFHSFGADTQKVSFFKRRTSRKMKLLERVVTEDGWDLIFKHKSM